MTQKLPLIDISNLLDGPNPQSESELYQAFSEVGFAVVVGHRVPKKTISDMREAVRALFEAPRDILSRSMVEKGNYRGYVPVGYFTPNSGKGEADQYEAWKLHYEIDIDDPIRKKSQLYAPNRWPQVDRDIKTAVLAYWSEMERVSHILLRALCNQLEIDAEIILSALEKPLTNMTLLNYPPTDPTSSQQGIHAHKDFDLITILAHDPVGGLEVRTRDGEWLKAVCPVDGLVVNVGDMLELWSGGHLISTPHRVTNHSGRERQSFPYFVIPRFDVDIAPLVPPVAGFDRMPLNSGRASADIWYSNWPDQVSTEPGQELGDYDR